MSWAVITLDDRTFSILNEVHAKGSILELGDENVSRTFKIKRRDFKRNRVYVEPLGEMRVSK